MEGKRYNYRRSLIHRGEGGSFAVFTKILCNIIFQNKALNMEERWKRFVTINPESIVCNFSRPTRSIGQRLYTYIARDNIHFALRRWERFARNVPSGEERGETDVFAGYPHNIAHSHDIKTILTSRQTREKLQCLYENLMSNNFRGTAVLKKI